MNIKVVKRVKEDNKVQMGKLIFSYTSDFVPRVGELIDFTGHGPYEVVQVIYCDGHVIVEVDDYTYIKTPPLSRCPIFN